MRNTKIRRPKKYIRNVKMFYNPWEKITKLFNNHPKITLEPKHAPIYEIGHLQTYLKVSGCLCLKILTPKQMLQRLLIALAHIKAGNTSENLLNEVFVKSYILCIEQKKLLKKYITTNWIQQTHKTKWILYLWIMKTLKYLIVMDDKIDLRRSDKYVKW